MKPNKLSTKELSLISLITALLCITGPLTIPLPFTPVQLSLMNFILYLSLYILGAKKAALSYLLYVFMGFIGLPVFSGFGAGLGKIAGPTGGYIVGFILVPIIGGRCIEKFPNNRFMQFAGICFSYCLCYLLAAYWLGVQSGTTLLQGFIAGVVPFIPGDLAKIALAVVIGPSIQKRTALS